MKSTTDEDDARDDEVEIVELSGRGDDGSCCFSSALNENSEVAPADVSGMNPFSGDTGGDEESRVWY